MMDLLQLPTRRFVCQPRLGLEGRRLCSFARQSPSFNVMPWGLNGQSRAQVLRLCAFVERSRDGWPA